MRDRLLRQLVPSVPIVARVPAVAAALDAADAVLRRVDRRYAALPPASLRLRIGVDNRLLRNAVVWEHGRALVRRLVERGWVSDESNVLELGSGVGRNAVALRTEVGCSGYDGIDVDAAMVAWCRRHLADAATRFHHADVQSAVYNPGGAGAQRYCFPVEDESVDLSLGISVFSHLLWEVTERYAAELGRVTKPGGMAVHTFFLLDHIGPLLGDRWSFEHAVGPCRVQDLRYPEAAVAYRRSDVSELFAQHGFALIDVLDEDCPQQTVVLQKNG